MTRSETISSFKNQTKGTFFQNEVAVRKTKLWQNEPVNSLVEIFAGSKHPIRVHISNCYRVFPC